CPLLEPRALDGAAGGHANDGRSLEQHASTLAISRPPPRQPIRHLAHLGPLLIADKTHLRSGRRNFLSHPNHLVGLLLFIRCRRNITAGSKTPTGLYPSMSARRCKLAWPLGHSFIEDTSTWAGRDTAYTIESATSSELSGFSFPYT